MTQRLIFVIGLIGWGAFLHSVYPLPIYQWFFIALFAMWIYILFWGTAKRNPTAGRLVAYSIPFEFPMCTRCKVILKKSGVMLVENFPDRPHGWSAGVLYCRECYNLKLKSL